MCREAAARRAGVMTRVGLDTFVDPRRNGCKMNDAARAESSSSSSSTAASGSTSRTSYPQVAIIRGTTADEAGNISMEHEGAYLGVLDVALAARNSGGIVIAQVKRTVAARCIPAQHARTCPSTLVDYVVVDPDQMQATQTPYDPAISGEARRPLAEFERVAWGAEKVIARRAAMELAQGDAVNLGFGISPLVPRDPPRGGARRRASPGRWSRAPVGGVPLTGFVFGCSANAESILPSPYQFIYYQGGGEDVGLLSFMEVGRDGSVNVSRLSSKPHVTAGCGGFVDITAHARKLVFSGFFRAAGLELDLAGRQADHPEGGEVRQVRARGRARHLLRPPGARAEAGRHLRHRAVRDPTARRAA